MSNNEGIKSPESEMLNLNDPTIDLQSTQDDNHFPSTFSRRRFNQMSGAYLLQKIFGKGGNPIPHETALGAVNTARRLPRRALFTIRSPEEDLYDITLIDLPSVTTSETGGFPMSIEVFSKLKSVTRLENREPLSLWEVQRTTRKLPPDLPRVDRQERGEGNLIQDIAQQELFLAAVGSETDFNLDLPGMIESRLQEIYRSQTKFKIYIYDTGIKQLIEKSINELTEVEKECVRRFATNLSFFTQVSRIVRDQGKKSDVQNGLEMNYTGIAEVRAIIDTTGNYIQGGATGVIFNGDAPYLVDMFVQDIDAVDAEMPHVAFPYHPIELDDEERIQLVDGGSGHRQRILSEATSNLTHLTANRPDGTRYIFYPSLASGGELGKAGLALLRHGEELKEDTLASGRISPEYYMTVEAMALEVTNCILDEVKDLKSLPRIMSNGGQPSNGLSEAEIRKVTDLYSGVIGILRLMNVITSSDADIDNEAVTKYIRSFDDETIRSALTNLYSKILEEQIIVDISTSTYNRLKTDGLVISELHQNTSSMMVGMKEVYIFAGAARLHHDANSSLEVAISKVIENSENTRFFAYFVINGRAAFIDVTDSVRCTDGPNGIRFVYIPSKYTLSDGNQHTPTGDYVALVEFDKPVGNMASEVVGYRFKVI